MDVRHRDQVTVTGRPGGPPVPPVHGSGCDQHGGRVAVPAPEGAAAAIAPFAEAPA